MNPFALSCFIIVLPLISQIVVGSVPVFKKVKWNFNLICLINMFTQIVCIIIASEIISINYKNDAFRCGMGQTTMLYLGIITFIVLTIVMGIQLLISKIKK
jgi:hypothetical protein